MGSKSAPAPAPAPAAPAPSVAPAMPDRTGEPANRNVALRADQSAAKASLMSSDMAPSDVDPLTQRKALTGGASLMG